MTTALICMCIAYPIRILMAFFVGVYIGAMAEEDKLHSKIKSPIQPKFEAIQGTYEPTEEERIRAIIDENIDNYGTLKPQKEVR